MSIELSSAPVNSNAATGAESINGKGKTKSGDKTDSPDDGEFSSVLTSMETPSDQAEASKTQAATDDKSLSTSLPVSEPFSTLQANSPINLTMLLAQAGGVLGAQSSLPLDGRTDELTGISRLGVSLVAKPKTDASAVGVAKDSLSYELPVAIGVDKSQDVKQDIHTLLDQVEQGLPGSSLKPKGFGQQAGAAANLAESRILKQSSQGDVVIRESTLSGALITSGMGEGFIRQSDRAGSKSTLSLGGSGIEGIWGQSALQAGSRGDSALPMAATSTQSPEVLVADTVSYWVSQGVQNAQLKLDGFGDRPVEVSITLKGDEAQISFRTDQPEIRQILEGAVAHLKDLLANEGMVLSGVSVGTSGQSGEGEQGQGNKSGANKATFVTIDAAPTERLQRVNTPVGRALDLYV